jgi:integrase
MKVAKTVFGWAEDHDWIKKSPMKKIPNGSFVNREKDRIVTMDEYAKLLEACPHQEWRTIIAFARIGGLRCPSELQQLRWTDVHWAENRFLVRSPKTEHHEGHRERLVPLFPNLRSELERHFSLDEANDNEFVIERIRGTSWNLTTTFQTIAKRAGLGKIVRPFDNMRMSRSNEVDREFGSIKESLWIGHSERVKKEHYYRLEDSDFAEAAGASLENQNSNQVSHAQSHAIPTETDGKMK